jgi:hypothetical protein
MQKAFDEKDLLTPVSFISLYFTAACTGAKIVFVVGDQWQWVKSSLLYLWHIAYHV